MKILILGASGFLGKYLVDFLTKKKLDITTCGRKASNNIRIKNYNRKNLTKVLLKLKPEILINLVAITNVDLCEKNKSFSKEINTNISKDLSKILIRHKIKVKMIFISTDQLYDGEKNSIEKNIKISNNYCRSKLNAEKFVIKSNGCVLRTNFFGVSKNSKSLVNWIIKSNRKKSFINVYENIYFSPLYVKTLCKYIYLFCLKNSVGVFNLGSNGCISKSEFAFYLIKKLKLNQKYLIKSKYSKHALYAKRPKNMCMNSEKFYKKFKIKRKNPYQELNLMLRDIKLL